MSVSLRWGIKRSFVSYVARVGGRVSCGAGATWIGEEFDFPAVPSAAEGAASRTYAGEVLFVAHGSLLRLFLAAPRLVTTLSTGLEVEIVGPAGDRARSLVALLEPAGEPPDADGRTSYRARLTGAGSAVFDGMYPPSSEVDLVRC